MARDFVRPEIDQQTRAEFLGGREVLVNPAWKDVVDVLRKTQKRCRKNILTIEHARSVWQHVVEQGDMQAWAGEWTCPSQFTYGIQGTVLQIVRIDDELIGLACERQDIMAGDESVPIMQPGRLEGKARRPSRWLQEVLPVFWFFLSDEEIERLDRCVLQIAMENAAIAETAERTEREALHSERLAQLEKVRQRRCEQMLALFRGRLPEFTSEFREATLRVVEQLQSEGKADVNWKEFKQRWPSIASRYQPELLAILERNRITAQQLAEQRTKDPYMLSLSVWEGPQRLFEQPQVVFSLRCPAIHRRFQQAGKRHAAVSACLKRAAAYPGHPGTANTIGWLRVHVDDEHELCFVDEVQSDTLEHGRGLQEKASSFAEETEQFLLACSDWHIHGFATIRQWARDIGYRVAMHSRESAKAKPGMTQSDRKWNTYYRPIVKRYGLEKQQITPYPAEIFVELEA